MSFYTGQKVICINDIGNIHLKKGMTYTITGFERVDNLPDGEGIFLAETKHYTDCPFLQYRFRPLNERKTNISFAHDILRKASKKAKV